MKMLRVPFALLLVLAALAVSGEFPTQAASGVHTLAIPASPGTTVSASAITTSKFGAVFVAVTLPSGANKINLVVTVAKHTLSFSLPARDFTQTGRSATLNTHQDSKNYGSIVITWTNRQTTRPAGSGNCVPTSSGETYVYYVNGKGAARLTLPCVGALALNFTGPYTGATRSVVTPAAGYFSGVMGTAMTSLSPSTQLMLTAMGGSGGTKSAQVVGLISKSFSGGSAAPLTGHIEQFQVTLPCAGALQVASDLGSATLDLTTGPKPLRQTKIQWTATTPAVGPSRSTSPCTSGKWMGGGLRQARITDTIGLQACLTQGTFSLSSSATTFGQLYSSVLKVQQTAPLKIVSRSPADGASGVSTSLASITVTFSNAMNTKIAVAMLQGASSTDIQAATQPAASAGNKTLTFRLTRPLQPTTTYKLTINAMDVFNQSISAKLQFTTGS